MRDFTPSRKDVVCLPILMTLRRKETSLTIAAAMPAKLGHAYAATTQVYTHFLNEHIEGKLEHHAVEQNAFARKNDS